jgi:GNAT superfamily N-acetyltransferase
VSVEIREAQSDDAAAIAGLLADLGYPADTDAVRGRLDRLAAEPAVTVLVASVGGEIAGLAGLRVENLIEHEEPAGRLIALVVSERHRRRGIGRELVSRVEADARERGCCRLVLTSSDARTDAHAFYRRVGFAETGRRFAMDLREPPPRVHRKPKDRRSPSPGRGS